MTINTIIIKFYNTCHSGLRFRQLTDRPESPYFSFYRFVYELPCRLSSGHLCGNDILLVIPECINRESIVMKVPKLRLYHRLF
jgi:hypothetical protein